MSKLFGRSNDEDEDTGLEVEEQDEEAVDEEEDDLSDLDEETQERLARYQARQDAKWQAEIQKREAAIEGVGLSYDSQGRVAIGDLTRASSYFAPLAKSRQEAEQPRQQPIVQQQEEEDEEWVDPSYDKAVFEKQLAKRIAKETTQYKEAITGLQSFIVEDRIEQAIERVEAAVERHAPYLAEVLEHPEFEEKLRQVLPALHMSQWRSSQGLAQVVGMIGPELGALPKKATPKQKPQERQTNPQEQMRNLVNRASLQQSAPSKSLSSGKGREYSDEDKMVSERLGISLEEAWAWGQDTTGNTYRQMKAAASKNGRR